jgi:hypothetical protein
MAQTTALLGSPNLGIDFTDSSVKALNSEVPSPSPGPPRLVTATDSVHPPPRGRGRLNSLIFNNIEKYIGNPLFS